MDAREQRKQAFMRRQQHSKQVSEGGGVSFFKGDLQNANFWKCEEGDHDLDIIPYIAGKNDPATAEGEWTYVLEVYIHRNVGGVEGQDFICLAKTYGKPCPICEHRQQLIKEGADEDLIKELKVSKYPRSVYNTVIYDSDKEEEKGVQIFATSHYLMEMHLNKLSESTARDVASGMPPFKFFADPEEGYSIRFTRSGTKMNTKFLAHQLVPRNYVIDQEILDQAHVLDELIHVPTYDEVYAAYWGEDFEKEQKTEKTALPRSKATSSRRAETKTGHDNVDYDPPKRGRAKSKPKATKPDSEPTRQDDSDQEMVCPHGGEYGVNAYELEQCETCEVWEACYEENSRLMADDPRVDEELLKEDPKEPPKKTSRGRGRPPKSSRGRGRS